MRQNAFEVALRYREGPTAGAYSAQPGPLPGFGAECRKELRRQNGNR